MKQRIATVALSLFVGFAGTALVADASLAASFNVSDATLVKSLPGLENGNAVVNGVRLHFVAGGKGTPVVLLAGWPETWWAFHKLMPRLAEHHRVISVDLRGMGASDKPAGGYDKKMMGQDIFELVRNFGYDRVDLVGHDIGAQVAFSFAAIHRMQRASLLC